MMMDIGLEVRETLDSIVELGHVVIRDGKVIGATKPIHNLLSSRWDRWNPTLKYLTDYARNHEDFGGEFFVCLYDGWREYSEPVHQDFRDYVPWLSPTLKRANYLGVGTQKEPRFRGHAPPEDAHIYPELCLPVLTYNRHLDDRNCLLIPDGEFLENQFSPFIHQVWAGDIPFAHKAPKAVWRGSRNITPGYQYLADAHNLPNPVHPRDLALGYSAANSTRLDASYHPAPISWMLRHRYLLDLDGMVNAWSGLFWKLSSNSVVIKMMSHWEQWYYDQLIPYKHYIPIHTIYDLETVIQWCESNPQRAEEIARNGTDLARSLTYEYATTEYKIR